MVRTLLNRLRERAPRAYWRARNAAALVQLYAHRLTARDDGDGAYDDAFWDFHAGGDWAGFARAVLRYVPAASVVDIGCGHGLALAGFRAVAPSIAARGFDESPAALRRAAARGLTIDRLDILSMTAADAEALAHRLAGSGLAICLEVAEHLPPWHADKLLTIVAAANHLVFSAAHPNQGGRFHVNEQPAEYWIDRLARRGLHLAPEDTAFRRDVSTLDLPSWYRENVHLFARGGR